MPDAFDKTLRHLQPERAFTALELIVVIATFGILILLLPAFTRVKPRHMVNCPNNLKQVGLAFMIWAGDQGGKFPMQVSTNDGGTKELAGEPNAFPHFRCMSNELNTPKILLCTLEKKRVPATNFTDFTDQNVSYFINLDCQAAKPGTNNSSNAMLICGDRNFAANGVLSSGLVSLASNQPVKWTRELHNRRGNAVQADGAVVANLTDSQLRRAFAKASMATNHLVLP